MRKLFFTAILGVFSQLNGLAGRGDIISAEVIRDWDASEANVNYWNIISYMIPQQERDSFRNIFFGIIDELMEGKRIVSYRVNYQTIDHYGNPTTASGLVLLPVHIDKTCELPIFYYGHGTIFERYSAPSRPERWGTESFFIYMAAALNFIGVAPDYYGMGDGPGFHHHNSAQTNSSSGIDLIRAARKLATQQQIGYNSQVFISGYSEGGHNAMGVLKMVYDQNLRSEFNIVSAGCGSGAYDLSDLSYHFIVDNPYYPTRQYILYLLGTCEDIYGNLINEAQGETVSTYLKHPYDSLYNVHLLGQDGQMGWVPLPWTELFNPGVIETVKTNPNHPFRQCLKQSNLFDWPNPFRTNLYYVKTDAQVYWMNSPKAKLAQWKYIPWYRFWDKARIATHDMTNGGEVGSHEKGAVPIMLHYLIYSNISKQMNCTEDPGRTSRPLPGGLILKYDRSVDIPVSAFPDLRTVEAINFAGFSRSVISFSYDKDHALYRVTIPQAQPGAYMLRLINTAGETRYVGLVYDEPNFLEDDQYSPVSQSSDGSWLLDMTLLEDKVSEVVLYTEAGKQISVFEDPYAVQQIAAAGELSPGEYVLEIHGQIMLYYLKFRVKDPLLEPEVRIQPNPFSTTLSVESIGEVPLVSVRLFGADGREVKVPLQMSDHRAVLQTNALPAGMYLLQIKYPNGIRTEKVVKF